MNLEQALSLLDGDDEYAGALTTREEYRAAAFVLADEVRKLRAAKQQSEVCAKSPTGFHITRIGPGPCVYCSAGNQSGDL